MSAGKIHLLPSPISDTDPSFILPAGYVDLVTRLDIFFVENLRTTRRFFSVMGIKNIDQIHFELLDKNTSSDEISKFLEMVENGKNAGIVSEAGCPGIADPGSELIRKAHRKKIRIIPVTGPSSIFLALMASGFNGQNFTFHGYLPIDKNKKNKKLKELESLALSGDQTQIFMETPYRNNQMFKSILAILKNDTPLCIAADITGDEEYIKTMSIGSWRKMKIDLHKKPAIFLIYRP